MLEVKGLYRRYSPKKGQPVVALNHVSVKFQDTGLIFILGKSGSGKSTLLNVMGGLDKCDSGEIIIKGKSSKDFRQSDFDSYRNTYLGFIFQEYNILDEFNVGQNIALALELQGKKATADEINKILDEVDLTGYGNRKTNELSGGQKQRVAIARALVKNPEIIFADEPTGALDSKTGMAVFDTLKKLSKDKLVVVVSHDREFAEQYGDRVIELADGNIISDIEKTSVQGNQVSKGLTIIDDKVIKIDKDYVLTPEDMELIREYLNKTQGEKMISLDGQINTNVRHAARIDEEGNSESFIKTDESKIENKPGEFKSIHSKLSLRHCFRIGGSSLKVKPFRLVITIILAIVAFGMFGLADTMGSYDKVTATVASMRDEHMDAFALEKNSQIKYANYATSQTVNASDEDIQKIKEQYGLDAKGVYAFGRYGNSVYVDCFSDYSKFSNYYANRVYGLIDLSQTELSEKGFDLLTGSYPQNVNEIMITKHLYASFEQFGYRDGMTNQNIAAKDMTPEDMVGKKIRTDFKNQQTTFTITGIVDTHFNTARYESLKNSGTNLGLGDYMLVNQYQAECQYGYHDLFYTNPVTIEELNKNKVYYSESGQTAKLNNQDVNVNNFCKYSPESKNIIMLNGKTSLTDNETVYTLEMCENYYGQNPVTLESPVTFDYGYGTYEVTDYSSFLNALRYFNWIPVFGNQYYGEAVRNGFDVYAAYEQLNGAPYDPSEGEEMSEEEKQSIYCRCLEIALDNGGTTYVTSTTFTDYYLEKITPYLKPRLSALFSNMPELEVLIYRNDNNNTVRNLTPVGLDVPTTNRWSYSIYVSDSFIASERMEGGSYAYLLCPMTQDMNLLKRIVQDNYESFSDSKDTIYRLQTSVTPSFSLINGMIETLAKVFLYVGIGAAVFASLMLFNFISISISYKKREIGILRAVGARSKDVFNIFFAESFIISMIAYACAIIATFVVSMVINSSLRTEANLVITILSPGVRQVALVLGVCVLVAFISTFLPVYKIAKKKPIDAIRDR